MFNQSEQITRLEGEIFLLRRVVEDIANSAPKEEPQNADTIESLISSASAFYAIGKHARILLMALDAPKPSAKELETAIMRGKFNP